MANKSKSAKKAQIQEANSEVGNIDNKVSIHPDEKNMVIFYMTDTALNKGTRTQPKFNKRLVKMDKENFVRCFASNFTDNGVFSGVDTPETIYKLLKNLDEKEVEKHFKFQIRAKNFQNIKDEKNFIDSVLKNYKTLKVNGSPLEVTLEDFVNVPDLEDADKMPEDI